MCLFKLVFLFYSDKYSEVGLLGHETVLFLAFRGISMLFSLVAAATGSPIRGAQGSLSPTSSTSLMLRLVDNGHSDSCEVAALCGVDLHFPGS